MERDGVLAIAQEDTIGNHDVEVYEASKETIKPLHELYRAAVIGSFGHRFVTRRLLRQVARAT